MSSIRYAEQDRRDLEGMTLQKLVGIAAVVLALVGAVIMTLTTNEPDCRPVEDVAAEVEVGRKIFGYDGAEYDAVAAEGMRRYAEAC